MDPSTSKFQAARPYVVLPISPTLAALYTNQSASSSSSKNSDWCSKCSSYLMHGTAELRVTRVKSQKRRHPSPRILQTTCRNCRWKTHTPICSETMVNLALPGKSGSLPSALLPTPQSMGPIVTHTPSPSSAPPPKSRKKKKTGLQVLLLQNREKEAQGRSQERNTPMSGGLAAFLSGL